MFVTDGSADRGPVLWGVEFPYFFWYGVHVRVARDMDYLLECACCTLLFCSVEAYFLEVDSDEFAIDY